MKEQDGASACEVEVSSIRTGAPAQRALASAGIVTLFDLAKMTRSGIAKLHGMGPSALGRLESALESAGLAFAPEGK